MKSKILWGSIFVLIATLMLMGCSLTGREDDMRPPPGSQRRVALVIGNANYTHASRLKNPVNDALDVSEILRDLKFDKVFEYSDASKAEIQAGVKKFAEQLKKDDIAFFFFSGHGLQLNRKNYLVPVEARINTDETDIQKLQTDIETQTIAAEEIVDAMAKAKVSVVALDACRNKLLPAGSGKKGLNATDSLVKGLASMPLERDTSKVGNGEIVVLYATKDGTPAYETNGRNSLFTKHLLINLKEKDLPVNQLLVKVGDAVREESVQEYGEAQVPYWYGSTQKICLAAPNCGTVSRGSNNKGGEGGGPPPPPPPI